MEDASNRILLFLNVFKLRFDLIVCMLFQNMHVNIVNTTLSYYNTLSVSRIVLIFVTIKSIATSLSPPSGIMISA